MNKLILKVLMGLAGLGAGLTMVSTYARTHAAALKLGYKDNIDTYLLISSKSTNTQFQKFLR